MATYAHEKFLGIWSCGQSTEMRSSKRLSEACTL